MKKILISGSLSFYTFLNSFLLFPAKVEGAAVNSWSASDGIGAVPVSKGNSVIDFRINSVFPGNTLTPTLNVFSGIMDGVEIGIGGTLNFSSLGSPLNKTSFESAYPWVEVSLPLNTDNIKTAIIVGSLFPVYNSTTLVTPGIMGLIDFGSGPLVTNLNVGYAREFTSGSNILSGNLNFTFSYSGITFNEEQFINYPISDFADGGFRASAIFPLFDNKFTVDINPAALWESSKQGLDWAFSPNIGVSFYL